MPDALTTKSITKIYRTGSTEIRAVDDVSIRVEIGEFVALVGPSGSGKTTMLAMLAGLLRPSAGEALINDQNLNQMKDSERTRFRLRNIGFTLQANNLVSYLTARENVELMLRLNRRFDKHGQRRARELLVRLGLAERLDNLPSQLSSGEQQRVAIARALVNQPGLLLADEPTGALDSKTGDEVLDLIDRLQAQGLTVIVVTHDPQVAQRAQRVITLSDGKVISDEENGKKLARWVMEVGHETD